MSKPSPHTQSPRPEEAERSVYCVLSSLTTTVHTEIAINPFGAYGRWTRRHDLNGQVLCGQTKRSPFRYLSIGLETSGELHEVYVVAERVLESQGSLLDLTEIGTAGGDEDE